MQNEAMNLSDNVKWGIRRKYELGSVKSIPLGKFYGYDKTENGELIVIEAQAVVVRRIYDAFLNGQGITRIAADLMKDGIQSDQGNAVWHPSSVRKILKNEKIKGDMLLQKTYSTDYLTKKRAVNQGELPQYYIKNSHPGIVDCDTWACVQLELARQADYCKTHFISKYQISGEENPLSARIICATCGRTYMLLKAKRRGEEGRKYWRCKSFLGNQSTVIEGRFFTPRPMALWSKYPTSSHARRRAKRRKLPETRQMLCSDIEIEAGEPERAFLAVWNGMIANKEECVARYAKIAAESGDVLVRYRAHKMAELIAAGTALDEVTHDILAKVLDHFAITGEGRLEVVFLCGLETTGT
jgi:hypothetical protein